MARILKKYDGRKLAWLHAGEWFAVVLLLVFLVFRFLLGVSWVDGKSMYPTLDDGNALVYLRVGSHYQVGDIVSVRMAYGEFYVKRVVAVGGDTVDIVDGQLYVNGQPEQGAWAGAETLPQSEAMRFPMQIPAGRYFVLGDNRPVSIDSRTFGAVSRSQIQGKIFFHLG